MHFPQGPAAKHEVSIMQCSSHRQSQAANAEWEQTGAAWWPPLCPAHTSLTGKAQALSDLLDAWTKTLSQVPHRNVSLKSERQSNMKSLPILDPNLMTVWKLGNETIWKREWKTIYNTRSIQIYISHVVIIWITAEDNTLRDNNMHKISWQLYFSQMYYFILLMWFWWGMQITL